MSKYFRSLDYVLGALAALQQGHATEVTDNLMSAVTEPDFEQAMDYLSSVQASCLETEVLEELTASDLEAIEVDEAESDDEDDLSDWDSDADEVEDIDPEAEESEDDSESDDEIEDLD